MTRYTPGAQPSPFFEYGFWWWYDPVRKGWYTGCAPAFGKPGWAA